MRKLILLLLLTAFVSACSGTISGLVIDENGIPVTSAIVQTTPPTKSVISTGAGYKITDVPTGLYTVTATKKNYSEASVTVKVKANKITTSDIQMYRITE